MKNHIVLKSIFNIPNITIFYNDFPFLPKRKKIEKAEKLVSKLHDEEKYVKYKNLYQALKSWVSFENSS